MEVVDEAVVGTLVDVVAAAWNGNPRPEPLQDAANNATAEAAATTGILRRAIGVGSLPVAAAGIEPAD